VTRTKRIDAMKTATEVRLSGKTVYPRNFRKRLMRRKRKFLHHVRHRDRRTYLIRLKRKMIRAVMERIADRVLFGGSREIVIRFQV
jgi:hypothetical protein